MTGIVLAGGKSSRFGRNKAFIQVDGEPIIERILKVFEQLFDSSLVVTNTPLEYQYLDVEIVTDIIPGMGALGGIYTGLLSISASHAFVVACDMPFLNPDLIRFIIRQSGNFDVVVPKTPSGYENLHALYSVSCIPTIERFLSREERQIYSFFPMVRIKELLPEDIKPYDPEGLSFVNINTPEDIERFRPKK